MITISVVDDLGEMLGAMAMVSKRHIPIASAIALTRTAKKAEKALVWEINSAFDRPTPWIRNSIYIKPATLADPIAEIAVKDRARDKRGRIAPIAVERPEVHGGGRNAKGLERALRARGLMLGGQYLVPAKDMKLDQYGNVSSGVTRAILASVEGGDGAAGKGKGKAYFVLKQPRGKMPAGIWQRNKTGVKLIFIIVNQTPAYRPRFDFYETTHQTIRSEYKYELSRAFSEVVGKAQG